MNDTSIDMAVVAAGGVALGATIWLAVSVGQVRTLTNETAKLSADVSRGATLAQLNSNLIQLMARTAAERNDAQLRSLLQANGVTFKVSPKSDAPNAGAGQ